MSRRGTALIASLLTVAAVLATASAASAARVEVVDGTAVFVAAAGEANDVRAGTIAAPDTRTLKVIDNGAPLTAGAGCQQPDEHSVWCPEETLPHQAS